MRTLIEKYNNMKLPVKASIWFTICSIVQKGIAFITIPFFTRLLTTEQFGMFNIYQSWMSIVVIFATLNIQYGVFDKAMIKYEEDRDTFISSMQGLTTLITGILFIIYMINPDYWSGIVQLPNILILAMFAEIVTIPALNFWSGKQKFDYKYKGLVIITLFIAITSPVVGIVAVLSTQYRGMARILALALVNVIICSIIYIYQMYKGKSVFKKKYWKYALSFNIPLIPYYLAQVILNQSDRLMIGELCGLGEAGIYGLAYSIGLILLFIINSINNSFVPWTYRKIRDEKYKDINEIAEYLLIFIASMLILMMIFVPEIVAILGAEEYKEAIWVVPPIAASLFFLFQAQLAINIEFYFEKKAFLVKASITTAIINLILNLIFIKIFGYIAAGYTTLICYVIFNEANHYFAKKIILENSKETEYGIYNKKRYNYIAIIFLILMFLIIGLYNLNNVRYLLIILGIGIGTIKRKYLIGKIKILKKSIKE